MIAHGILLTSRSGRTGEIRRAAIDDGSSGAIGQCVAGDFILAGKPDARLALRVAKESIERTHPAGMAGDAVMKADHHHAPARGAFFVELVELVAQRLLVSGGIPALERKRDNVVHVESIGNGDEVASAHRNDERLVMAWLVDMIEEAEGLQGLQNVGRVGHPVGIPPDVTRAMVSTLSLIKRFSCSRDS